MLMKKNSILLLSLWALFFLGLFVPRAGLVLAQDEALGKAHFDPVIKNIEGWTVHVDPKMLQGKHAREGARALTMLANHLQRIAILMPNDRLEEMRELEIWGPLD